MSRLKTSRPTTESTRLQWRSNHVPVVVSALLGLALSAPLTACQKKQPSKRQAVVSAARQKTLVAVGLCAADTYRQADELFRKLRDAVQLARAEPTVEHQEVARGAWSLAMQTWQQAEVMQFGPAAAAGEPGGMDLRNQIYSWPLTSRCLVDQTLFAQNYSSPDFPSSLVNLRGMDAAEYLLFYQGTDNGCAASATLNTSGDWVAIDPTELSSRKAAYTAVVLDDVVAQSSRLVSAWDPAQGNFGSELSRAGSGSPIYPTQIAALNQVSDAMFYVERQVKDMKLARPLGLLDCTTPTCPEALESRFAQRSKAHILNNLRGFDRLFRGCGGQERSFGIDDLLVSSDAEGLAQRLSDALDQALRAGEAIEEEDLAPALVDDYASVQALHDAIKVLTDLLKTEFVTVLTLDLPLNVQGDND